MTTLNDQLEAIRHRLDAHADQLEKLETTVQSMGATFAGHGHGQRELWERIDALAAEVDRLVPVVPSLERLSALEAWVAALEAWLARVQQRLGECRHGDRPGDRRPCSEFHNEPQEPERFGDFTLAQIKYAIAHDVGAPWNTTCLAELVAAYEVKYRELAETQTTLTDTTAVLEQVRRLLREAFEDKAALRARAEKAERERDALRGALAAGGAMEDKP